MNVEKQPAHYQDSTYSVVFEENAIVGIFSSVLATIPLVIPLCE